MSRRVVVHVSGQVQGVGFRWFVRTCAERARVSGSARNLLDGRVEMVFEGPDEDVAAVLADLQGPCAPGTVTAIDSRDEPAQGTSGFTIT
jgi:acylphosphatase